MRKVIGRANSARLAIGLALTELYAAWFFLFDSPMTRARASGVALPEMQPGLPERMPAAAIDGLGPAAADYFWMQFFDMALAAYIAIVALLTIGLALRRFRLDGGDMQYLLLAPALYLGAEIVEDSFLALMTAGIVAPTGPAALLQQAATSLKFLALLATALIAALAIFGLAFGAFRQWAKNT